MSERPEALFSPAPSAPRDSFGRRVGAKILRTTGWLGIVLAVLGLLFVLLNAGYAIYRFTDTRNALLARGLDASLAKFLAWAVMFIACSISFIPLLRIVFWKPKRYDFVAVLATPLITFLISLIPANFGPDGNPLRYCANRPGSEPFCLDHKGADPLTGLPLQPMTTQMVLDQMRRKSNLAPQPVSTSIDQTPFFDSLNGDPLVWYSRRDEGCFDLFNHAGVNPRTGQQLLPVNNDIVKQIASCDAKRKEADRLAADQAKKQLPSSGIQPQALPPSRYFEPAALQGGANWTVVAGRADPSALATIIPMFPHPVSVSLFKPAFFSDGRFDQALLGDAMSIKRMSLPDSVARVVLIKAGQVLLSENRELEGLIQANETVQVTSIDPRSGRVLESQELRATGAGFSRAKALERMTDDLGKKARETLASTGRP